MSKPKVAFYWNSSCGGCEEAVIDLAEDILKVVEAVDIVFWPVALDFKRKDVEAFEDGEIAVSFINGAIRTGEQEDMVNLLRRKSGLVVAFGSCAHIGGIPGLANFNSRAEVFDWVYSKAPSVVNDEMTVPQRSTVVAEGTLELPEFYDTVRTLDQVIDVDYYLPGCAPPPDLIMDAVTAILESKLPAKGAVLAPNKSLCDTCARKDSKPERLCITEVKRVHQIQVDPEKCFLEQGLICLGPATRSGCGERCINANMTCRGCFGSTDNVLDQGAKFLSSFASIFGTNDEEEIKQIVSTIDDPAGIFNFYSLPSSLLGRKKGLVVEEELVESVSDTEVAAESIAVYVPEPGRDQLRLVEEHIKQVHDDLISKESAIERLESTVEELRVRIGTAGEGETALNDNGDREIIKNTEDHLKDLHDEMKKTEIEIEEMEKMIEELGRKIAGDAQKDEEV